MPREDEIGESSSNPSFSNITTARGNGLQAPLINNDQFGENLSIIGHGSGGGNYDDPIGDPMIINIRKKLKLTVDDLQEIYICGCSTKEDPLHIPTFRGMYKSASGHFERFMSLYEDLTDNLIQEHTSEGDMKLRSEAKRYYYGSCTIAESLKQNGPLDDPYTSTLNQSVPSTRLKAKLPHIPLPSFDGQLTSWQRFKDTFQSLVIKDPELSAIDKFHFLTSCLSDSAYSVIADLPVTEANFCVAWQALLDSYDNKRLVATAYLDQLLNIKPLESKPSIEKLKQTTNLVVEHLAAFRQIQIPDKADFLMFYIARRCFDRETRESFELLQEPNSFPSYDNFIKFLRNKCTAGELAAGMLLTPTNKFEIKPSTSKSKTSGQNIKSLVVSSANGNINSETPKTHYSQFQRGRYNNRFSYRPNAASYVCPACKDRHYLINCQTFNSMDIQQRQKCLNSWEGCKLCLYPSHTTSKCRSQERCRFCRSNLHNSLLHYNTESSNKSSSQSSNKTTSEAQTGNVETSLVLPVNCATTFNPSQILMGTALCSILDVQGQPHTVRLVVDSGSMFSFMSKDLASRLGLHIKSSDIKIIGIGQTPFQGFTGKTECRLQSLLDSSEVTTQALVVEQITSDLPTSMIPETTRLPFINHQLADPEFWNPKPVEFLLGSDLFAEILTGPIVTIAMGLPKLIGTIFGYVITGKISDLHQAKEIQALCATVKSSKPDLSTLEDLKRLWELDEPPSSDISNPDDLECEIHFQKTHYRLPSGRYVVSLPFKGPKPDLPSNRWMAMKRLSNIERKLQCNLELKDKYCSFMQEYERLGHMTRIEKPGQYLIPHHGVFKTNSDERKIRVVFDASAPTGKGSLNDYLHSGPKLQNSILVIMLNFRLYKIVFTVDLVKMFRQISLNHKDRQYQHILWREDPSQAVMEYELCTVTYGQASASYLAQRVIQQLVIDEGGAFPLAAEAIMEDMYVDDLATGSNSIEDALEKQKQVIKLMSKGEFPLSKWMSNHPSLLDTIEKENRQTSGIPRKIEDPEDKTRLKILGLQWDPNLDSFSFEVSPPETVFTKRSILAAISRIYDPLGLLGPIIIVAKAIIQSAWKSGIDWDASLPQDLQTRWRVFLQQLPSISRINIPRWIVPYSTSCSLFIFGDASETAYCATAYLRTSDSLNIQSNLLMSKTKLAPIKPISIPRLELCAALLATKLLESLEKFCAKLPTPPSIHLFSDSTIVLGWLNTPPHQLKTFVANRVVRILKSTKIVQWSHIRSEDNPSDLGSRGVTAENLIDNSLWFNGPEWVKLEPSCWPIQQLDLETTLIKTLPERKTQYTECLIARDQDTSNTFLFEVILRTSSYIKLLHIVGWVVRFCHNIRNPEERSIDGTLTFNELEKALGLLIKVTQELVFNSGKKIKSIPKHLQPLRPFLDSNNILRVGGRLANSHLPYHSLHPYILPAKCRLTSMIINYYHINLMHTGPSHLHSIIRRRFWIINSRNQVRQETLKCVRCRRFNAPACQPIMADVVPERLNEAPAFTNVGVDFAGPFLVRESSRRKAQISKAYMCLFICLSSRSIHLEAVTAISTSAFIAALDRFVSRRGLPALILSDNGTNFVGAANELKDIIKWYNKQETKTLLHRYASEHQFIWKFIPPHAPHWGGSWEAGVRSAKRLLRTTYGEGAFTFEELATLLTRIEAILNSRPIAPMSNDPENLDALTPGHLLIGRPLIARPEYNLLHLKENRLDKWQLIQQRTQSFWKRWKNECLHELQVRGKWTKPQRNLAVNDMVIIKGEDTDRQRWPLGRIVRVFPGRDGVVRAAEIRTSKGFFSRPATKLIVLQPIDSLEVKTTTNVQGTEEKV